MKRLTRLTFMQLNNPRGSTLQLNTFIPEILPNTFGSSRRYLRRERNISIDESIMGGGIEENEDLPIRYKPAIVEEIDDENEDILMDEYGDDGEPDPRKVISRRLLAMGKVMYKHIEPLPDWFMERRATISAYRTPAQIRRCLQDWMIQVDRETNAKFRDKPIGWKIGPINAEKAANIHAYGPEETIAYAHYFMPPRYSITRKIFSEMKLLLPNFKPTRIIDFGCGPGTAGAAAYDIWGEQVAKYAGIDMSRSMLEAGKIMFEKTSGIDTIFWNRTADVVQRAKDRGERYDLAIISYTLSELTNDTARRAATQMMYELLDVGGILVIIETGNPVGSHIIRSARKLILENFNENVDDLRQAKQIKRMPGSSYTTRNTPNRDVKDPLNPPIELILPPPNKSQQYKHLQASVIAPCSHDKACPLAPGSFCSFSQKVLSGIIRKDAEEKYSYVVIQKSVNISQHNKHMQNIVNDEVDSNHWLVSNTNLPEVTRRETPTPLAVLKRVLECKKSKIDNLIENLLDEVDWETYSPPLHRNEWSRIIRSPIKANGHITMDVCSPAGSVVRHILSKGHVHAIPALYVALRKTTWGGLFPYLQNRTQVSPFSIEGALRRSASPSNSSFQQGDEDEEDRNDSNYPVRNGSKGKPYLEKNYGERPDKNFFQGISLSKKQGMVSEEDLLEEFTSKLPKKGVLTPSNSVASKPLQGRSRLSLRNVEDNMGRAGQSEESVRMSTMMTESPTSGQQRGRKVKPRVVRRQREWGDESE